MMAFRFQMEKNDANSIFSRKNVVIYNLTEILKQKLARIFSARDFTRYFQYAKTP